MDIQYKLTGVTMNRSQDEYLRQLKMFELKIREVVNQTTSLSSHSKGDVLLSIEEELHEVKPLI